MKYEQIPLEEQLKKAADGFCIHPEYSACTILLWGKMPIADYLGGDTEEGKKRYMELMKLLNIQYEKGKRMSYCAIAECINSMKQKGKHDRIVEKAMRLLARPLADGIELWKGGRGNG